jgi:hypothetical protein
LSTTPQQYGAAGDVSLQSAVWVHRTCAHLLPVDPHADSVEHAAVPLALFGTQTDVRRFSAQHVFVRRSQGTPAGQSGAVYPPELLPEDEPLLDPLLEDPLDEPLLDPLLEDPLLEDPLDEPLLDPLLEDPLLEDPLDEPLLDPLLEDPLDEPLLEDPPLEEELVPASASSSGESSVDPPPDDELLLDAPLLDPSSPEDEPPLEEELPRVASAMPSTVASTPSPDEDPLEAAPPLDPSSPDDPPDDEPPDDEPLPPVVTTVITGAGVPASTWGPGVTVADPPHPEIRDGARTTTGATSTTSARRPFDRRADMSEPSYKYK